MDIKGINYEEFTKSFMELAEEKKKCGLLEARVVALEDERQRQEAHIERVEKEKAELKEQIRMMTIHNTAMSLKELFYMGQYRLSTEKMRAEFARCAMMRDGLSARLMVDFAVKASLYDVDDESRRLLEDMIPVQPMAINYNGPIGQQINSVDKIINE